MYEESIADGRCSVHVVCDHCPNRVTVVTPTHDRCQWELYRLGWWLHKHQQLCPKHAEIVARKLRNE